MQPTTASKSGTTFCNTDFTIRRVDYGHVTCEDYVVPENSMGAMNCGAGVPAGTRIQATRYDGVVAVT